MKESLDAKGTFQEIYRLLEAFDDPVKMAEYKRGVAAKRARRAARHEGKVLAMVSCMSDECELLVHAYEREGAKVCKYFQNRVSKGVAVMLTKTSWWDAKGRMGKKLIVVYPDGSRSETYERSITIRPSF